MDVRASDTERDACVERLRAAAAEGRLTFEELADRIEAASSAVTRGELTGLTSDLPATLVRRSAAEPLEIRAADAVKRSGAWLVPAESHYRTWMGNIKLDLRQATITEPEIHIHARTLFGNIDLLVPEGVEVDLQARPKIGQVKHQA